MRNRQDPETPLPLEARSKTMRQRYWGRVFAVGRVALASYLIVVVTFMWFEELLIFPAPKYPQGDWQPEHLVYDDIMFQSADGTQLHGWYFEHARPRGFLLYCHGNGTFVPALGDFADQIRRQHQLSVLIWDYRGYGRSDGKPNEHGVFEDARAARRWLAARENIQEAEIILMGRSLGGAVAVELAAEAGARALILQNTFHRMVDVAAYHYPWLPIRLCLRTKMDSLTKIPRFSGPLLQSHGSSDRIVPIEFGRQLFDAAGSTGKQFFTIDRAGHNEPHPSEYYQLLEQFLVEHCDTR